MEPGRELDALVAEKVMGFRPKLWKHPENAKIPHYSSDIAAAWEVIEKVGKGKGRCFELGVGEPSGKLIFCSIKIWNEDKLQYDYTLERSDSAPHAICLAALKAIAPEK